MSRVPLPRGGMAVGDRLGVGGTGKCEGQRGPRQCISAEVQISIFNDKNGARWSRYVARELCISAGNINFTAVGVRE